MTPESTFSTDHCLRPQMTRYIIQLLQRGKSINLHGPPGMGKTRLLEDIKECHLPDTRVALVSFRGHSANYAGFCRSICQSAGLPGKPVESLSAAVQKLVKLDKHVFLLIDDCQSLTDNPDLDPKFDQQFIESINSLKNTGGISMLMASLKPLNSFTLFVNKKPVSSVLDLHAEEINELSHEDLLREIDRRFPGDHLSGLERSVLAGHLNNQDGPYGLLEYYQTKILNNKGKIDYEILQNWLANFKKTHRSAFSKRTIHLTKRMKLWTAILNPIQSAFGALKKSLQGPVSFLTPLVKQLLKPKDDAS